MHNPEAFSREDSIKSEQSLLAQIQAEQIKTLNELGIIDKARLVAKPPGNPSLIRVAVGVRYQRPEHHKDTELVVPYINLVFEKTTRSRTYNYAIRVAQVIEDAIWPEYDFTDSEAMIVDNMRRGLQDARDMGMLPHLSPDLSHVVDSSTAVAKATTPPDEQL